MRFNLKLTSKGQGASKVRDSLASLTGKRVLVGIPSTNATERMQDIIKLASLARGKRRVKLLAAAAKNQINNAELIFIHTNGSPLRKIPARPIIEPAILQAENLALITEELELAAQAALDGKSEVVAHRLKRAGMLAQNIVRKWFTDSRNHWAPNSPSTIKRKGSSQPLIDIGELRKAITYVVEES